MRTPRLIGLAGLAVASVALLHGAASAQMLPPRDVPGGPPPGVQGPRPMYGPTDRALCVRLESELARIDAAAGGGDAETIRRYEDAIGRQRYELDQTIMQGQRLGCDTGGGFFIFGRQRPQQCDQLDRQVRRMRGNLDRMMSELGNLRGGTDLNRDLQRRQLVSQLAQNNCGPQYRQAAPQPPRSRNLLESLFGGGWRDDSTVHSGPLDIPLGSTFRTVCVRTCDGYFFPISFATVPSRFHDDERACQRLCPAAETILFTHRNPGEDIDRAVSVNGYPYADLPNAFKYRTEYNPSCSCRAQGQSWAEALGVRDETVQRGDILVTEERARQMSQPRAAGGQGAAKGAAAKGEDRPALRNGAAQDRADGLPEEPAVAPGERRVRIVGPEFYPVR